MTAGPQAQGYILAIDQGTTSTRAILFDRNLAVAAVAQKELPLYLPQPGWVEQNADIIWQDTVTVCRDVMLEVSAKASGIAAIGITNQRETTIVWDRQTGKPVHNAIVWQDRRTAAFCDRLRAEGLLPAVQEKTGLLLDPYFSATKIAWILDNVDGARARAERGELAFGTVECFLLWKLTAGRVHATDATNASRTMLFNIRTQQWDDDLLRAFGVPRALLPKVVDNSGDFGTSDPSLFGGGIAVAGMAGDQQAALFGQACHAPGMVKSTYGTGCFALMNIGGDFRKSEGGLLTTVGYRLGGRVTYAVEGAIFSAGSAVQWLRDGLGIIGTAAETANIVRDVADTGGVYLVPAFTGLGAPYWAPEARAAITGITRGTDRRHIVRAALEAQGYQTRDLLQAMAGDSGTAPASIRVDGGMVANDWVCQFIADMVGVPVDRPGVIETTSLGAAMLAGLGCGFYPSAAALADSWQLDRRFVPVMPKAQAESLYSGWRSAVSRVLL